MHPFETWLMTHLYHGTIKGYWDFALQQDKLQPFHLDVVKKYVSIIAPLLLGHDNWFDKRVEKFQKGEGAIYLSDSKRHAEEYAITYPEIVTASLTRLRECLESGKINAIQMSEVVQSLEAVNAFFKQQGGPLIATLDIPQDKFQYTGLPNEVVLLEPIKLTDHLIAVEQVKEPHLFFLYYGRLTEIMKQKGISIS